MAEIVDFGLQQHKIKMDSRYFENVLSVVAGDTGRRLEVQLLDTNGMVQDTTGLNLRLNAEIAGKATFTDATLVDAATGKYQLDLSNGMFLAPGNWQFQWLITDSAGKKLHSFAFTGNIGKNISEGGSQATNFYLNLEDLKAMQDDLVNGTFDSSILETNITEKLTDLETQYAPKLTEVTAQLAETNAVIDERKYNVGVSQKYKTLNQAFDKWLSDGMPTAFIHVRETLLEEYLNIGGLKNANRLTIMGDDKYTNIWKYTNGGYAYAPFTGGGNITIKNFTVIADHEGEWLLANGAYGLHIDHPNAEGEVIVEDCIVKSYQDAAIGSGTSKNQIITLKNVDLFHYANSNVGGSTGRWHGAFFYHTSNTPGATGQKLNLENVYAYSEFGPALALQSSGQGNQEVVFTALNVTARSKHHEQYTGSQYDDMVSIANTNGLIKLDKNNRNNNSDRLNFESLKSFQRIELTDSTGRAIAVTDFNNVTFGNFRGENALNAPNNRAFVGFALRYSSVLVVQYAFDVLLVGVSYRRQNTGGTWSSWAQVSDVGLTTTTVSRPSSVRPGFMIFDTNLQKPIWWNGSAWKDATGATV